MVRTGSKYVYRPGVIDRFTPVMIKGKQIQPGSKVIVTERLGRAFAYIRDEQGNEQSVFQLALRKE